MDFNSLYFDGDLVARERPVEIELYALKALAYANLEDFDEARSLWAKAVALNPNYDDPNWLRESRNLPDTLIALAATISNYSSSNN